MTEQSQDSTYYYFAIDLEQVERFLDSHGFPPLTAFERRHLQTAFNESIGGYDYDIIHETVSWLRNSDCSVAFDGPTQAEAATMS